MVKLFELIKQGKEKLIASNTPQLDAEVILSHILGQDRIYLYLNRDLELPEDITNSFFSLLERRIQGEPVSYLTGFREFMGLNFEVRPGVLIPRADTEILVEAVINKAKEFLSPVIADIGCGSGAIAVSLARNLEGAELYALDIMEIPLEVTRLNAARHGVEDRVHVIKSDILDNLDKVTQKRIDVIVSNPPYIEEDTIKALMRDVRDYEPLSALSGGRDGLDFYRRITSEAGKFLKDGGILAYEIGYNQREAVVNIMEENGYINIECIKDLGGNDRVVIGRLKEL